jgi:gliding motility-associated-like protein
MIGMQDFNRTQAVMVPGRRASDAPWAVTSNNNQTQPMEAYSFIPTAPTAAIGNAVQLFKRVQLYDLNGNLVATGTVAPGSRGTLEASFPNICSPLGTTSYVVRSFYEKIDDPTSEIFGQDTIRVTRNGGTLSATLAAQPTLCDGASGSLTATVTTGTAPYTYALNNSATPQNSNVFSGLAAGAYSVTVRDAQGCSAVLNGTITLQNNLTLQVAPADTALCSGRSFVPRVQSNAASYSWTPAAGLSATNVQAPTITPAASTTYTVTGTLGACTTQQTLRVNLSPSPTVNAGADQSIIAGDMVQLSGTASQGTYLWSPAAGLNAVNVLDPVASPQVTTTYTLSVTNPQGCSSTDDVVVTVVPYCVKPMEAFSPNGDGMNDLWLVTNGNCLRSAKVEVFNRYGAKVFESQDYKNNWNGTYNGRPVADGTYYFIISYQLINGKTVFQRGNVAILR